MRPASVASVPIVSRSFVSKGTLPFVIIYHIHLNFSRGDYEEMVPFYVVSDAGLTSPVSENCGKDAHKHFYDHASKCPTEGARLFRWGFVPRGALFIAYNLWQEYQNRRKARFLNGRPVTRM